MSQQNTNKVPGFTLNAAGYDSPCEQVSHTADQEDLCRLFRIDQTIELRDAYEYMEKELLPTPLSQFTAQRMVASIQQLHRSCASSLLILNQKGNCPGQFTTTRGTIFRECPIDGKEFERTAHYSSHNEHLLTGMNPHDPQVAHAYRSFCEGLEQAHHDKTPFNANGHPGYRYYSQIYNFGYDPEKIPQAMLDACKTALSQLASSVDVVRAAAQLMHQIGMIHPFGNGNGRVCRTLVNWILLDRGQPAIDWSLTSKNRTTYYHLFENPFSDNLVTYFQLLQRETAVLTSTSQYNAFPSVPVASWDFNQQSLASAIRPSRYVIIHNNDLENFHFGESKVVMALYNLAPMIPHFSGAQIDQAINVMCATQLSRQDQIQVAQRHTLIGISMDGDYCMNEGIYHVIKYEYWPAYYYFHRASYWYGKNKDTIKQQQAQEQFQAALQHYKQTLSKEQDVKSTNETNELSDWSTLQTKYQLPQDMNRVNVELLVRKCANAGNVKDLMSSLALGVPLGVDVNASGSDSKKTALHQAVIKKHIRCIKVLVRMYKARYNLKDSTGKTAMDYSNSCIKPLLLE